MRNENDNENENNMDKMLRAEIIAEVRRAMADSLEIYREQWVTGDELTKQVQCFTKSWLKTYGSSLPRERATVMGDDGEAHSTGWCYPLNRIRRMVAQGEVKNLTIFSS